jgi:hypothetical protein
MKDECDSKEGKLSFTGLDTAEPNLILCKDDTNERKENSLLISRVRLILYKDNANEWKESLLLIFQVQLILYKDTKFQILYTQNILYMRYMHTEYYNCS